MMGGTKYDVRPDQIHPIDDFKINLGNEFEIDRSQDRSRDVPGNDLGNDSEIDLEIVPKFAIHLR